MHEIAPGVFHWTARHPEWRSSVEEVQSYALVIDGAFVLIDPQLPPHADPHRSTLLMELDTRAGDARRVHVVAVSPYHTRSAEELCRRWRDKRPTTLWGNARVAVKARARRHRARVRYHADRRPRARRVRRRPHARVRDQQAGAPGDPGLPSARPGAWPSPTRSSATARACASGTRPTSRTTRCAGGCTRRWRRCSTSTGARARHPWPAGRRPRPRGAGQGAGGGAGRRLPWPPRR